jgi:hypothetical protein
LPGANAAVGLIGEEEEEATRVEELESFLLRPDPSRSSPARASFSPCQAGTN